MAVTKLWPVTYNLKRVLDYATDQTKTVGEGEYTEQQYQALADVLAYAENEEKTEKVLYVQGINCHPQTAREDFIGTKLFYGKTDGIQAYHGYMSFKEQNITPELAQKVGLEFVRRVWGERFQVVVTTHLNTGHLHCHYVINSVSYKDGKRLHGNEKAWIKFRHIADEVCRDFGLYYEPNPDYAKQNSYYYHKEKAGMPTRYSVLRETLDEIIAKSRSISEFRYYLEEKGYRYQLSENRKYWTVIPIGYDKPIRLYKLGENYTNEAIKRRLNENFQKIVQHPFQPRHVVLRRYNLPTREDKIKKVGGLYGLYLYYCYKLGYLPKYQRTSPAKIHYIFREDWLKIDKISAQTRLLGREHISTIEQLHSFRAGLDTSASMLLSALIYYLHYEAPEEEQNFSMVMEMLRAANIEDEEKPESTAVDILFDNLEYQDPEHIAVKYYRNYHSGSPKTLKSIQITLAARLEKFNLASLAAMTALDELDLDSLGEKKVALFALIPDNDSSFNFLVSILYTQLIWESWAFALQ